MSSSSACCVASPRRTRRHMKVFFVPYYFYLHYESFRRVIGSLNRSGADAFLLYVPGNPFQDRLSSELDQIRRNGCPFLELPLRWMGWSGPGFLARSTRVPGLVLNRKIIETFLRKGKPDLVVVGSDLGGVYIRLLLDACRRQQIPVMILATSFCGPSAADSVANNHPTIPGFAKLFLRALGLGEVALFDHWLIGSFLTKAPIAVPGEAVKKQLVAQGISPDRFFITGDPAHDRIFERLLEPAEELKRAVCHRLGWSADRHLIVYCTEVIHELYGMAYLERINAWLAQTFDTLPPECGVLIKLHPREKPEIAARFGAAFRGERYRIVADHDLHELLRVADLCIGHFSKAMVDAILMGVLVATIDLQNDESHVLLDKSYRLLRVESEEELGPKLRSLLFDPRVREAAAEQLAVWRRDFANRIDGQSSQRTADLIRTLASASAA